jgi:signal transduction histidine kinase
MNKQAVELKASTRIWPIVLLLAIAISLATLASWNTLHGLAEINAVTDGRAKARQGRMQLQQTFSLLKDMETGMRGFALTGDARFLNPYQAARSAFPMVYGETKTQLADHLPDGFAWDELDRLMALRQELATQTIDERIQFGKAIIDEFTLFESGRMTMDRIRVIVDGLDGQLNRYVEQQNLRVAQARQRAEWTNLILFGTTLLLIGLSVLLTLRERRLRLRLEGELRDANRQLEARVAQRTAELAESERRLTSFAIEQGRAIEQERRRVAREVHDQIGQVFTAIKLIVMSARRGAFPDEQATALNQAIEAGILTTRRITADLRPPLLDDLGLAAALQHLVKTLAQPAQLDYDVSIHDYERLSADQSIVLFRIVQEALTNVVRHAAARHVSIIGYDGKARYHLSITDDGKGFSAAQVRQDAFGLENMRERALLLGGTCRIAPRPEGGTVVEIELPLKTHNADERPAA